MTGNPFSLKGKLAMVTGGATGIGFAITKSLISSGAQVVITGRREQLLKESTKKLGNRASYLVNNITDLQSIPLIVKKIESSLGALDILVNNAGINELKPALEVSDEDFKAILDTNLNGLFALTREVAKYMVERKQGSIIMITSMTAIYGLTDVAPYAASKSAVLGLTRSLASDLSPFGIRINAIAPGFIETPMHVEALKKFPEKGEKILDRTPIRRFGLPEDIGNTAVFLASEASSFITGVQIPVDGGNSIGF